MDGLAAGLLRRKEEGQDGYSRVKEGLIDRRHGATSSSTVETHEERNALADSALM